MRSWVTQIGPKPNNEHPYKEGTKDRHIGKKRRPGDNEARDWHDVGISQGVFRTT